TLIILIGSTGLQVSSHKLITDNVLLAGLSMAIYGLSLCGRRPVLGGFWLGTGAGVGFMAKGLLVPGILALTVAVLIVGFQSWRRTISLTVRLAAYGAVLPWVVIWPVALYQRSPALFKEWFFFQNLGRFFGVSLVGQKFEYFYYLMLLTWFALPSLPIALWAVWRQKGEWKERKDLQLVLVLFTVILLVLSASSGKRDLYALLLLPPLSLLAGGAAGSLPERAALLMNRIALVLFGTLAVVLWVGWAINLSGAPVFLASRLRHMQPDYTPVFSGPLFAVACMYTILWIFAVTRSVRYGQTFLLNWTSGIVLVWGLAMTIWLPWFDAGSSLRPQFMSLREHIPEKCRAVMTLYLGESENALLEYYTGVKPHAIIPEQSEQGMISGVTKGNNGKRKNSTDDAYQECDWLLIENMREMTDAPDGLDWKPVFAVRRPIDPAARPKETFTLLTRNEGKRLCN
ncbi:MAG TPA: glycosyltransferase family 39 protein, partial [Nitrospirota bacterium]